MSARCPNCGFSYAWDGQRCNRCKFVSLTRTVGRTVGVVAPTGMAVLSFNNAAQAAAAPATVAASAAPPVAVPAFVPPADDVVGLPQTSDLDGNLPVAGFVPPADDAVGAPSEGMDGGSEILEAIGAFLGGLFEGLLGG